MDFWVAFWRPFVALLYLLIARLIWLGLKRSFAAIRRRRHS